MKIFKCVTSGDELFTDDKEVDIFNGFYKIIGCNLIPKKTTEVLRDYPEAEHNFESPKDDSKLGIDVVVNFKYKRTYFINKKEYASYMKDYSKELMNHLGIETEDQNSFKAEIQMAFNQTLEWFNDIEFYTTQSMQENGMIIICKWEAADDQSDDIPVFYYYKLGIKMNEIAHRKVKVTKKVHWAI